MGNERASPRFAVRCSQLTEAQGQGLGREWQEAGGRRQQDGRGEEIQGARIALPVGPGIPLWIPDGELRTANRQLGFSLVEMMVALALGSIVVGALLTGLYQTQNWAGNLSRLAHRDSNLQLAQLLLSRLISSAGNNLGSAQGVEIQSGQLILRTDLTGAAGGFPDGSLDDPFESLALRHREGRLQLQSGEGAFQSLIEPVESFEAVRHTPQLLQLKLAATTSGDLAGIGQGFTERLELWHSLPNQRPNLFAKED